LFVFILLGTIKPGQLLLCFSSLLLTFQHISVFV